MWVLHARSRRGGFAPGWRVGSLSNENGPNPLRDPGRLASRSVAPIAFAVSRATRTGPHAIHMHMAMTAIPYSLEFGIVRSIDAREVMSTIRCGESGWIHSALSPSVPSPCRSLLLRLPHIRPRLGQTDVRQHAINKLPRHLRRIDRPVIEGWNAREDRPRRPRRPATYCADECG